MTGNNPVDRSKLGTKRHILTDKDGIPLSVVISSANIHDIKLVTNVIDNVVVKRPSFSLTKHRLDRKRKQQHLCIDKAYNSKIVKQGIIKRGYLLYIPQKRKRGEEAMNGEPEKQHEKKYSARRCRKNEFMA